MKQKIFPTIILLSILFFAFLLIFMKFYDEQKNSTGNNIQIYETKCGKYKKSELKIDSNLLFVDIADDKCKMELGLSGKESLNEEGMLFIFGKSGNYGFWMKDMNFPLDILWINDNFEIVGIEKNIATSTYPKIIGEKYFAKYVLEIPVNYFDKDNIKVGDKIIYNEK